MKKMILSALAGLFAAFQGAAQSSIPYAGVTARIIQTYNEKNNQAFYDLLSANFKAQQSVADITSFLKELHAHYGSMKTIRYLCEQAPFQRYQVMCRNGNLELLLACNEQQQIEGLSFQPYQEPLAANQKVASDNPKQTRLDQGIDSLALAYLSMPGNVNLSIGIIKQGQVQMYHYGETRLGSGQLPSSKSVYEIGSITKTFTGILLAKAISEQKVKADDDIRLYLPPGCKDLAYRGMPITLLQLANHTSGLPRLPDNLTKQRPFDAEDPYRNYTKQLFFSELAKQQLKTTPGAVSEYSNGGMALLGIILAEVYGMNYEELVREKITGPLQMANTWKDVPAAQQAACCTGYNEKGKETSYWHFADFTPCGGLRSTLSDMMLYLRANLDETDRSIALSHQTTFSNTKYSSTGMAWQKQQSLSGGELIWHNGGTYGFSSFMGFAKDKSCGVVVLSNSGQSVDGLSIQILKLLKD